MPEVTPPEGQGNQTPEGQGGQTGTQTGTQTSGQGTQTPEAGNNATFTQADVDRILKERLARATPADYEDLKAKAAKFDQLEESQKTELQKAQDKATAAETKAAETIANANARLMRAEITMEAAKQGADADLLIAYLAGKDDISVDKDGNVTGVADAVKKALKDKPALKLATESRSSGGGEFGGTDGKTVAQQIAELERKGDRASLEQARELKIGQMMGGGR